MSIPAASMVAVPTIMLMVMALALKRPGIHKAKLRGSNNAAARSPNDIKPKSLIKEPCVKWAATIPIASNPTIERRV